MKKVKFFMILSLFALASSSVYAETQSNSETCSEQIKKHSESYNKLIKRNKFLNTKYPGSTAAPDYHLNAIRNLKRTCK